MAYYLNPNKQGLKKISSFGDGDSLTIDWYRAFANGNETKIGYNIYIDIERPDFERELFRNPPSYLSISNKVSAIVRGLDPGQTYRLGIRAVEYSLTSFNVSLLQETADGLKIYPESQLRESIDDESLIIPLIDASEFPSSGVIKIGTEIIAYSSIEDDDLILSSILQRGYQNTIAMHHEIDGYFDDPYSGVVILYPIIDEEKNTVVYAKENAFDYPEYAFTIADGYRQTTKDLLNTDLSYVESVNSDFTPLDTSGYHRIDTAALLRGECVGSYFGGEQGCVDGYGFSHRIRGLSVQDMVNQREEKLLSLTGEPIVLLKRQTIGIRCRCINPQQEQPDARCLYCFPAGTLIRTELGMRPIENIVVGEKVLSSDGSYQKVIQVFVNEFKGKLKAITSSTSATAILTTPEHPFMTMRGTHSESIQLDCGPKCNIFIDRGDGVSETFDVRQQKNGKWHARIGQNYKRIALGSFETKEEAISAIKKYKLTIPKKHELQWDDAKNIKEGDWLVPIHNSFIQDIEIINIPQQFCKNTKLGSIRNGSSSFDVDEEFCWIVGLYLAEGSPTTKGIQFSLHDDEVEYQNRVISFFKKYGYNAIAHKPKGEKYKDYKGTNVIINGSSLAGWFKNMFGTKCYNKKIPEFFMNLPNSKTWSIFQGVWAGDGFKDSNEIGQTSEILALQLVEIIHRNGKQGLIYRQKSKVLTPKGNKRRIAYIVSWGEDGSIKFNRTGRWKFENNILSRVKEVEDAPYDGLVYNLEVEGDHTYVVQNTLVHNCMGVGYVLGFNQFFNSRRSDRRIMVRFESWIEQVPLIDSGLEVEQVRPNAWLGTEPIINPRDILIRFGEDGNEEFRYEVLTVGRNMLFEGNYGAQKLTLARIRKTDHIYSAPYLKDGGMAPGTKETSKALTLGIPLHSHTIQVNDNPLTWGQITSMSAGHSHLIRVVDGVISVSMELGHLHTI